MCEDESPDCEESLIGGRNVPTRTAAPTRTVILSPLPPPANLPLGLQHEQIGPASRSEELQISVVTQINEPNSLYGIIQSHKVKVMKESPTAFSALTYAPQRSVSKSQEQPGAASNCWTSSSSSGV